jgi:hypothetical protein
MNQYTNAALPDFLAGKELRSPDGKEFALSAEHALAYLDLCDQQVLTGLGFDVWAMTEPQRYALPHLDAGGNSSQCRKAITSIEAKHAKEIIARHGVTPAYNIWVETRA